MYTNAKSIISKLDELTLLVADEKPDIILITESWCNHDITNAMINIPGYNLDTNLRQDRCDTMNGIGVGLLVYSKIGLVLKKINMDNDFNQFCKFSIMNDKDDEKLNVTLIYRPPNSNNENVDELMKLLQSTELHELIIGDFNVPSIDWTVGNASDWKGRRLIECADAAKLTQIVDFATHNKGNILDLMFTNRPESAVNIESLGYLNKCDHQVLNLTIEYSSSLKSSDELVYDWSKADNDGMNAYFRNLEWKTLLNGKNAEESWQAIKSGITTGMNNFVPKKPRRINKNPVWLTRQCKKALTKKRLAWKKYKSDNSGYSLTAYKKAEAECKKNY